MGGVSGPGACAVEVAGSTAPGTSANAAPTWTTSGTGATPYSSLGAPAHGFRNIEGQIMAYIFKPLVNLCVKKLKILKSQDNISLYCDLRQFMTYVKEAHGGVFRRVVLSGILDSSDRPNQRCNSNMQTTRVIR